MKRLTTSIALAILFTAGVTAQDFDTEYEKVQKFKTLSSLMYNGPVTPVWKDASTFLYSTNEASGEKVYQIDLKALSKTAASRDSLDALSARTGRPGFDGEDFYRMRRSALRESPDGKWVAFIKDSNVWVIEKSEVGETAAAQQPPVPGMERAEALPSGGTQLSFDGTDDDKYVQIMWSPDSKKIAALRREVIKERQILLRESRPDDQVQPKYRWLDYAKPGDALPQAFPALFDVEKKQQIPFATGAYANQFSLDLGEWSSDSKYFTFEYNQRGHQLYQLVAVDAESGKNSILAEEKTDTFVYYDVLYRHYFKDGRRILWASERDNWRHLYMIDAQTGKMTQLTKGEWNVREILNIDEEKGRILFYANGVNAASGEDPYNKHVLSLDLNSGKWKDLTPENAFHTVSFNRDFTYFVDNMSRPDLPTTAVVRDASDGRIAMQIHTTDISAMQKVGYTMPEVFCAKGRDGVTDIWGTIYRPANFNPKKKYPVVEYIYSGPHDSHVTKEFLPVMRFTRLVEMGFIVVTIDGMGTDNRSKDFQDVAWRNLKDAGFPDRILWMQAAAQKYKYMDLSKVGIYGYSAGGQNTLSALLFYPEFYKVGVALCGCHDNRMDKIWWNEQWMGWPVGPWYSENSNVDNAWRLEGKLFLINGEMDDNVDPASTLQVVAELIKNNKDFEQLYLPGHTHNLGSDYITRRVFKYFWDNCR